MTWYVCVQFKVQASHSPAQSRFGFGDGVCFGDGVRIGSEDGEEDAAGAIGFAGDGAKAGGPGGLSGDGEEDAAGVDAIGFAGDGARAGDGAARAGDGAWACDGAGVGAL